MVVGSESTPVPTALLIATRAARCMVSFLDWDAQWRASRRSTTATRKLPVYMRRLNAGWVLAAVVWAAVAALEKAQLFQQTLPLLRLLLSSKCTPHRYRGAASRLAPRLQWLTHPCCYDIVLCVPPRRGRWYGRMAINLVHLKRKVAAWRVSVTALEDPAVIGGDRLSLQRRLARLEKQLGAQTLQRARVFTHAAPVRVLAALQGSQQRACSSTGFRRGVRVHALLDALDDEAIERAAASVWHCGACTLLNSASATRCVMCHHDSPLAGALRVYRSLHRGSPMARSRTMSPVPALPPALAGRSHSWSGADRGSSPSPQAPSLPTIVPVTAFTAALRLLVPPDVRRAPCVERSMVGMPLNRQTGEHSRFLAIDEDVDAKGYGAGIIAGAQSSKLHVNPIDVTSCDGVSLPSWWHPSHERRMVGDHDSGPQLGSHIAGSNPAAAGGEQLAGAAAVGADLTHDPQLRAAGVVGVEELSLQFYATAKQGGWLGTHCEGGLLHTLFGLLMWPVLFAPIKNAFWTPYVAWCMQGLRCFHHAHGARTGTKMRPWTWTAPPCSFATENRACASVCMRSR